MNETNTAVVLDVDGVMYPYSDNLALVAIAHTGRPAEDFPAAKTWSFFKNEWNMSLEEYLELVDIGVEKYNFFHEGTPYDNSIEGVQALIDLGVEVHIATDLGSDGDPKGHRRARTAWLNARPATAGLEVTFTPDKASVAAMYLARGNVVYALEDKVENYRSLIAAGAICYLVNRNWNQHEVGANRVDDVLEFAEIVRQSLSVSV
jgi:hypothetical protein